MADIRFYSAYSDGNTNGYWRTNQSTSGGQLVTRVVAGATTGINTFIVVTDSDQKIEVRHSASNANTSSVNTNGWYFPRGM